jgi:hypothetical protein
MKLKLEDVIDAMDFGNPEIKYYYSVKTEEVLMCFDGMINGDVDPKLQEDMEENFEDYIPLPGQYEIDEYSMMEEFIDNLVEGGKKDDLADSVRGRGAFRRFKDTVHDLGLEQKWFKFRDAEYKRVAREWCEDNRIEVIEEKSL